jgi:hypothetical protein
MQHGKAAKLYVHRMAIIGCGFTFLSLLKIIGFTPSSVNKSAIQNINGVNISA